MDTASDMMHGMARRRLVGALLALGTAMPATAMGTGSVVRVTHDVHVSYLRLVIEGPTVAAQVRLFHDDLQHAVRAHARQPALVLASAAGDSAFMRYFAGSVAMTADGVRLAPRLLEARTEQDRSGYPMRVYVVESTATRPVRALALRDALLFEHFRDQQNLAVVVRAPEDRRTLLYFAAGDPREQIVPP